jgi:hypothetical protein
LLEASASGLPEDAVAEARALGPERAGEVVVSLIGRALKSLPARAPAIRAVHLAAELRLTRVIPVLVAALQRLPETHPLRLATVPALLRFGSPAVEPLLAAFERARPEERTKLAEVLARIGPDDDRISAALLRLLEEDPVRGAEYLALRGEWRAIPSLARAMDELTRDACECAICGGRQLAALSATTIVLGGELSDAHKAAAIDLAERADAQWIPFEEPRTLADAARLLSKRHPRLGRNDPCHCGSGKKYKRCHLAADEASHRH